MSEVLPNYSESSRTIGNSDPSEYAEAVTPHDTNTLDPKPRALYVGGAGTVVATMLGKDGTTSSEVSFVCQAGAILPIRPSKIKSTGTTATSIVGLY